MIVVVDFVAHDLRSVVVVAVAVAVHDYDCFNYYYYYYYYGCKGVKVIQML